MVLDGCFKALAWLSLKMSTVCLLMTLNQSAEKFSILIVWFLKFLQTKIHEVDFKTTANLIYIPLNYGQVFKRNASDKFEQQKRLLDDGIMPHIIS